MPGRVLLYGVEATTGKTCAKANESGVVVQVSTGALRTRWPRAHGDARITSMAFDLNFRRLITGCENGSVKVCPSCECVHCHE